MSRDGTEREPLLARSQSAITTDSQFTARRARASRNIINTFIFIILLQSMGDQVLESPQTRIQESVICYRYWEKTDPSKINLPRNGVGPGAVGGVDELWCKSGRVQSDLAMLRGWQLFFDGIPSLLLAVPFGWMADRFGRKPFLMAGLIAVTSRQGWIALVTWFWQPFDIRLQWLSTIFASLGGGATTTSSLAMAVLSDVTPATQRGAVFLRVGGFNLLANLLMPPLAAWSMALYTPWIPVLLGILLNLLSTIVFAFTPETLNFGERTPKHASCSNMAGSTPPPSDSVPNEEPIPLSTANAWLRTRKAMAFLIEDWRVPVIIPAFLLHMLLGESTSMILQYMSYRYSITLAKSTMIATIRSGMVVATLFLIVPSLSRLMVGKLRMSPRRKDLSLARTSEIFVSIGWFAFGFAPNIPIAIVALIVGALGQSAPFLLRSFLTYLLPKDRVAIAYSIIAIVDNIGIMFGSPLLAWTMKTGFTLGGMWTGLPFYCIGVLSGILTLLLFVVGLRKGEEDGGDQDDGDT